MIRLRDSQPPNPRLQRTPSAPLSRQPLGNGKKQRGSWALSRLARVFLSAVLVLGARSRLHACSCVEYLTDPVAALKKSGLVFSGEVVTVEIVSLPRVVYDRELVPSQYMDRVGVVTLRTIKEWKGDGAKQYVVLAGAPPVTPLPQGMILADCRVHLEIGKKYLVFATDGFAEANDCAPTGDLEQRREAIAALDSHVRAKARKKS